MAKGAVAQGSNLERLLKRDRVLVALSLLIAIVLSSVYILSGAGMGMSAVAMSEPMRHMGPASHTAWTVDYTLTMFLMWWVMMIAMMLPSATPTILLAAALNRRSDSAVKPYGGVAAFCLGYLLAWAAFSVVAVALQWWLEQAGMLSMHLETLPRGLSAGMLLAAGAWQLTPLKAACLRHCRSPADFLVRHRRPGAFGALRMGAHHGAYCLGCCWFLMGLLFVGGVMNLYWIVGLAVYVFLEKVVSAGPWLGRVAGVALLLAGILVLANYGPG